jgi:predicted MFS family arabinose efflux permease
LRALNPDFVKLCIAFTISNIGDGLTMVAGPLLAASLTRDPILVAGAAFAQNLPCVLFALVSGAYVDRVDRRRLILLIDLARGGVMGGLAIMIVSGTVSLPLLYAVCFLLGTGAILADLASVARLPTIVPPERLASATAILMATFTIGNQIVAKPLGAALWLVSRALPFGIDATTFVAAAMLVASMRATPAVHAEPARSRPLRLDIAEGIRWVWKHQLIRTLSVSMAVANFAFGAAFSVFVLYVRARLGLSAAGYGLLLTTFGIGGLLGTAASGWLRRTLGAAALLRAGLFLEAVTHLTLAVTRQAWVAAAILIAFGVHSMVWGVTVSIVRQVATPNHLLGRVVSVDSLLNNAGTAAGTLVGGVVASAFGLAALFWVAGGITTVVAFCAWRPLAAATEMATPVSPSSEEE